MARKSKTIIGAALLALAKDGANIANARTVRTADGHRVFNAGSCAAPGSPGAPMQ